MDLFIKPALMETVRFFLNNVWLMKPTKPKYSFFPLILHVRWHFKDWNVFLLLVHQVQNKTKKSYKNIWYLI